MTIDVRRMTLFVLALAAAVALTVTVLPTFAQAESPVQMSVMPDDGDPEPPKVECEERCKMLGERVLKACLDGGGNQQRCENQAAKAVRECLADCPKNEEPPTCEEQCKLKGERILRVCLDQNIAPERCEKKAAEAVRVCIAECPPKRGEPAPDPKPPVRPDPNDCEGACKMRGRELYKVCVRDGGTPERCERRAKMYIEKCIKQYCPPKKREPAPDPQPPVRPDPNDCETACREHGRTVYTQCMAKHDNAELCRKKAANAIEECIEKRCPPKPGEPNPDPNPPVRPAPDKCVDACTERGKVWYEQCVKEHNAPERCKAAAAEKIKACITENCPKPVEPPTCKESCQARGKVMFEKCMEKSGDEKACRQEAADYIKECVAKHCPPNSISPKPGDVPKTCEDKCGMLGRQYYDKCLKSSLAPSPELCRERAGKVVRQCIADNC